jgi:cbb3-type cytochrome oxidase maturation protein
MNILILLVPLALLLVAGAVVAFVWASRDGQFDDLRTPSVRLLFDEQDSPLDEQEGDPSDKDGTPPALDEMR